MSKIIFVLLALMAILCNSSGRPQLPCGLNEEYKICGLACEPTCFEPHPLHCITGCKISCQCESGYLRNGDGVCILPEYC